MTTVGGGRRRLLVGLGAAVVVVYLLLLAYILWGDLPDARSAATAGPAGPDTPSEAVELWPAYEQAREAAQAVAQDAQLLSASTQWEGVGEQMFAGVGNWSFVFYAPASGRVLDVVVGGEWARVVNQTRIWTTPQALAAGAWEEGPRDALLIFMAYGGQAFLARHPQAVVDLRLAPGEGGGAVWTVAALATGGQGPLSVTVDAATKQVLASVP